MYAIVDIETTGGQPEGNGITEIAIVLHNGTEVEGRYETLINPGYTIPPYVVHLTGITNQMVSVAPRFEEVAENIYRLLQNRVFIAHNVNFDCSFIKHHFRMAGIEWSPKKLCTLKLSRKAFPGYARYGLEHICRSLEIKVTNRHRAGGDANATAILFGMILEKSGEKIIREFLKKENREQILPPNLPNEQVNNLPGTPGVYYFHNSKGKVVYVGKAINLKSRVVSHFTGLSTGKKRQGFLRDIHAVSCKECPTELTACILESVEIKRLWPIYNVSQKRPSQAYGIYQFEDGKGYLRLAIDKKRKYYEPVISFNLMTDAHRMLWKVVKEHELHPALCFLDRSGTATEAEYPEPAQYNSRVEAALKTMKEQMGTYAIFEDAPFDKKSACVLVESGRFYGMGLIPDNLNFTRPDYLKPHLTQYPENEVIRSMISSYAQKYPSKVMILE